MKFLLVLRFVVLVSNAAAVQDLSGKMFVFPQETATDHVRLTLDEESFTAVTVCHRTLTELKRDHTLFSLAVPSAANGILVHMDYSKKTLEVYILNVGAVYESVKYARNKWNSICTTWASNTGMVQVWLNEQRLTPKYTTKTLITGKPIITLGQDQDNYGGKFQAHQSFVGMMTDVHMWDIVVWNPEIQKYMKNQSFVPGTVLNWAALDFEIKGNVIIEPTHSDACREGSGWLSFAITLSGFFYQTAMNPMGN